MGSKRAILTPQMTEYAERLPRRWTPYVMYSQPAGHDSPVVHTDKLGFRVSHGPAEQASPGGRMPPGAVDVIAGSSAVFGTGATCDEATLPSRLWSEHAPARPWLNFGARSYNSVQELLLFLLHRHLLPEIAEIVVFSGFNTLALAGLPSSQQCENGAFYYGAEFAATMSRLANSTRAKRRATRRAATAERPPQLTERIAAAANLTVRNLASWRSLAGDARLTFVLQPLASWVRERPAPQEQLLFAELDALAEFSERYSDIAAPAAGQRYADALRAGCAKIGVRFFDLNPVLANAVDPDDWVFVDRIHFTDEGYDLVAELLATELLLG